MNDKIKPGPVRYMGYQCNHLKPDGFHYCASYAFNLHREGIDQGTYCDAHYWKNQYEQLLKQVEPRKK